MAQLELLDQHNLKTGETKERMQVHFDGDWHASAHLWLIDQENKILLQERSDKKRLFPGMWVAPVSGHVDSGSSPLKTIVEEAKEEIQLEVDPKDFFLQAVIRGTYDDEIHGIHEHEYISIYIMEVRDPKIIDLNIRNDEMKSLRWFALEDFRQLVEQRSDKLVPAFEEYEIILAYIKYNK